MLNKNYFFNYKILSAPYQCDLVKLNVLRFSKRKDISLLISLYTFKIDNSPKGVLGKQESIYLPH
jgi:hypothetical protein